MNTATPSRPYRLFLIASGLALCLACAPGFSRAEGLHISPPMIVLNAGGNLQDITAIVHLPLESGYRISQDFEIWLTLGDGPSFNAYALRYCYVDENLFASFDRSVIAGDEEVRAMAGDKVKAEISGWLVAIHPEYEPIRYGDDDIAGSTEVTIKAPGLPPQR